MSPELTIRDAARAIRRRYFESGAQEKNVAEHMLTIERKLSPDLEPAEKLSIVLDLMIHAKETFFIELSLVWLDGFGLGNNLLSKLKKDLEDLAKALRTEGDTKLLKPEKWQKLWTKAIRTK